MARLKTALRQAERHGLLGGDICGSHFSFRISIRLGAGAFVCGEETALIASIEGQARNAPAAAALSGASGAVGPSDADQQRRDVRQHRAHHPQWRRVVRRNWAPSAAKAPRFSRWPAASSNTGLIEVPMGTTLRDIIFDIGGGIPGRQRFKAVQTGGPSGGCIPEEFLDTPVDYETLTSSAPSWARAA